jgi:hypothetical protein
LRGEALDSLVFVVEDGEGSVRKSIEGEGKEKFAGALTEAADGLEGMSAVIEEGEAVLGGIRDEEARWNGEQGGGEEKMMLRGREPLAGRDVKEREVGGGRIFLIGAISGVGDGEDEDQK